VAHHRRTHARRGDGQQLTSCYDTKKNPYKYTREGSYHIFIFPTRAVHALKIRQINSAILKVPDGALIR
jgi:hypothetical protein